MSGGEERGGAWGSLLTEAAKRLGAEAAAAGADPERIEAVREALAAGCYHPLPSADGAEQAPGGGGWPPGGVFPAADGWLVAGPSQLPAPTLAALLGLDPAAGPARLSAGLAGWTRERDRAEAAATLQSWRTYFTPVLDPAEAAACREAEAAAAAPAPPAPTPRSPREELVVDLTHLWAGPLCTRLLADLGATIVKVEAPRRPDPMRLARPPYGQPSFDALNHGKLSLGLDLGAPADRECLLATLAAADGAVDNFSPRAWRNWGLDPGRLAAEHGLTWISMSAFGAGGPYAGFGSRGAGVEGTSGHAWLHARDGAPRLLAAPLADPLMGIEGASAYLAAGPRAGLRELSQNLIAAGAVAAGGGERSLPRLGAVPAHRGPRARPLGADSELVRDDPRGAGAVLRG